jgi:hypothetical protein
MTSPIRRRRRQASTSPETTGEICHVAAFIANGDSSATDDDRRRKLPLSPKKLPLGVFVVVALIITSATIGDAGVLPQSPAVVTTSPPSVGEVVSSDSGRRDQKGILVVPTPVLLTETASDNRHTIHDVSYNVKNKQEGELPRDKGTDDDVIGKRMRSRASVHFVDESSQKQTGK